ncbi:PAS domain S-box protein [Phenylobacterium sp. LH3H17]|uniref:PAS domain-containing hybrid sensor histidine kinase/response regulator n=1 Tax=Phenylobacterium sp. LH3H17 TaxID=2903901 RepID=UPI0020C9D5E1|nr:PAS domain S-box protein [Phenylobacterium sp. LH3H17]UTP39995.1 PAS domain S-box protein [Phenylobacterium sp. LH3H17]
MPTPQRIGAANTGDMARWLFSNSREVMFIIGGDGQVEQVNPAFERATGWTQDEISGRGVRDIVHHEDLADYDAHLARLVEGGTSESLLRLRTRDGGFRWFDGRAELTADGRIVGVALDVTEERRRADELATAHRTQVLLSVTAGIGSWVFEPETDTITWSEDILSVTGYAPEEIADSGQFEALLHPDEAERIKAIFIAGTVKGQGRTFEHRMRGRGGRWTSWRATFHTEPRPGGAYALVGVSQNITELAKARDEALRGQQQIHQLIENAPFAVAMFDRQLRYMVVSNTWRQAFKLDQRDHIGLTLKDVFPTAPKRLLDAQARALTGELVRAKEDRFTDGQGTKHWVRWEARPWRDAKDAVQGIICYVDDISALAEARTDAQQNAHRLKLALEAADAGVYEIDHRNKTVWVSPEYRRLLGGHPGGYEAAQQLKFPRFHPDDVDHVRQSFRKIRAGREAGGAIIEARVIGREGAIRWTRIFHRLKHDSKGRPVKGVGMIQDFDERKRQELALVEAQYAAQAAGDAKAAFLANMSHEIRTPMNGVMGVLHLLKSEALSEEGRKMLEEALSCGQMLAELLNDVIDFSKIEAGRLELACEPTDPRALIEGVARLLRPQAEAKGLLLNVEIPADLGWVRTDPVRLRQALFNLIGNAVKFTLAGQVTIRAALKPGPVEPLLRLEVADTGVGIPEAVQPRIFQRFDQGDASTTRKFGGSGLGLAITQRLAEMLGGKVGFASTEGVGSIFWLEVAAPAADPVAAAIETNEPYLEGLKVLVVEDNPTNRMIVTKLLENLGAVVETAADGLLGVEAAARGGFDLILMDVQMPGIDGLEACRRIRALGGQTAATPIVALTANVLSHQRQSYLAAGMDGVVGKPISPAALLAEISRLSGDAVDEAAA